MRTMNNLGWSQMVSQISRVMGKRGNRHLTLALIVDAVLPTSILAQRTERRRVCLARDNRIRKVVIWRFLMCVRIRRVTTVGRD